MIWIDLLLLALVTVHMSISWSHKQRIERLERATRAHQENK